MVQKLKICTSGTTNFVNAYFVLEPVSVDMTDTLMMRHIHQR